MPRAGVYVTVAPTDATTTDVIVLLSVHDAVGVAPSPSPSAS